MVAAPSNASVFGVYETHEILFLHAATKASRKDAQYETVLADIR